MLFKKSKTNAYPSNTFALSLGYFFHFIFFLVSLSTTSYTSNEESLETLDGMGSDRLSKCQEINKMLMKRNKDLESENSELKGRIDSLKENLKYLGKAKKERFEQLQTICEKAVLERDQLSQQVHNLAVKVTVSELKTREYKVKLKKSEKREQKASSKLRQAMKFLAKEKATSKRLEAKILELKSEKEESSSQNRRLQSEIEVLRQQNAKQVLSQEESDKRHKQEISRLSKLTEQISKGLVSVCAEVESLRSSLKHIIEETAKSSGRIDRLEERGQENLEALEKLESDIKEVVSSEKETQQFHITTLITLLTKEVNKEN